MIRSLERKAGPAALATPIRSLATPFQGLSATWKEGSRCDSPTEPYARHTLRSGLSTSAARARSGEAVKSQVEIADSLELVRHEVANAPAEGPYKELMATYAEWGELLEAWNKVRLEFPDDEFEERCAEYLERVSVLGKAMDQWGAQMFAVAVQVISSGEAA